jgi:Fe-S-cluster containining protein
MAGCTGKCCETFSLPYTIEEIRERVERGEISNNSKDEFPKLLDMLIPIDKESEWPETHWYKCKYFNYGTKKCMNYENRPIVCKQHPVSEPCPVEGCTEPMTTEYRYKFKVGEYESPLKNKA